MTTLNSRKIKNNSIDTDSGCYNSHMFVNFLYLNFRKNGLCVMLKYPDNIHVTNHGNWFPIQCSYLNDVVCSKPVGQYMYFIMNLSIYNTIIYLFKMQFIKVILYTNQPEVRYHIISIDNYIVKKMHFTN